MLTATRTSTALLFPLGSLIDKKKKKTRRTEFCRRRFIAATGRDNRDNSKRLAQKSSKYAICVPQKILVKFSYNIRNILLRIFSDQFVWRIRLIFNIFYKHTPTLTENFTTKLHWSVIHLEIVIWDDANVSDIHIMEWESRWEITFGS